MKRRPENETNHTREREAVSVDGGGGDGGSADRAVKLKLGVFARRHANAFPVFDKSVVHSFRFRVWDDAGSLYRRRSLYADGRTPAA